MHHVIAILWIILLIAASNLQAAEPDVNAALTDALLCRGNPIDAVRKIAALENQAFDRGFAGMSYGEDMDTKDIVVLKSPLIIAGSKASAVVVDLASSYSDFNGIVFAVFHGDYRRVVDQLGLKAVAADARAPVGKFEKSVGVDMDGKADDVCPMTIGLTPLEKPGEFLLGCGWCNG